MADEILEGNELIATFMGPGAPVWEGFDRKSYHNSWDWLMPVVEKIEQMDNQIVLKVYISINDRSCGIWNYFNVEDILRDDEYPPKIRFRAKHVSATKIKATWLAVIDFIKWYNSNTPIK